MNFLRDEKGQLSAELLLVLAAVVAVAVLLITQLRETGTQSKKALEKETKDFLEELDKINKDA